MVIYEQDGYLMVYERGECKAEHRIVYEETTGEIPEGHIIHHVNGIRDDNRPENLICMTKAEHSAIHSGIRWTNEKLKFATMGCFDVVQFANETLDRETADHKWHSFGRRIPYPPAE